LYACLTRDNGAVGCLNSANAEDEDLLAGRPETIFTFVEFCYLTHDVIESCYDSQLARAFRTAIRQYIASCPGINLIKMNSRTARQISTVNLNNFGPLSDILLKIREVGRTRPGNAGL
jgi:hypothetical protein